MDRNSGVDALRARPRKGRENLTREHCTVSHGIASHLVAKQPRVESDDPTIKRTLMDRLGTDELLK